MDLFQSHKKHNRGHVQISEKITEFRQNTPLHAKIRCKIHQLERTFTRYHHITWQHLKRTTTTPS